MKIKEHEVISISFRFALVAECLQLNDEFTCFTAPPNLNAKKCWDCMQEGGRKNCITEVYPVLIHCWIVDAISLLC